LHIIVEFVSFDKPIEMFIGQIKYNYYIYFYVILVLLVEIVRSKGE